MGINRIIAFAGRKESGKTELAKICEEYGYNIISFATPLKNLISELLDISLEDVNNLKKVKNNYILNDDKIKYFSERVGISFEISNSILKDKIFETTRDALQFIGTDIIRKYNPSWHVDLTKASLNENEKYCIDDMRFKNEKDMVDELGGDSWFIIRPLINNISNHESETSLLWQDFDKIIINDISLSYLKFNWSMIFQIGYDESVKMREKLFKEIKNDNKSMENLFNIDNNDKHFNILDTLFLSKYLFDETNEINLSEIKNIEQIDDKTIKLNYEFQDSIMITHPLLIESLKIKIN